MHRTTLRLALAFGSAALAMVSIQSVLAQQVLTENDRLASSEVLTTKTIFAFRNLPDDAVKQTPGNGDWVLSKDAIIGAALDSPALSDEQRRILLQALTAKQASGDSTQAAVKLALAAYRKQHPELFQGAQWHDYTIGRDHSVVANLDPSALDQTSEQTQYQFLAMSEKPVIANYPSGKQGYESIDKVALGSILEGVAAPPQEGKSWSTVPTITAAGLVLDPNFASGLRDIYDRIAKVSWNASPAVNGQALSAAKRISFSDPKLAATALSTIGKVDFGRPIAYTVTDKKLDVEASVKARFDVYWIDFAFSPSEDVINASSELNFSVTLNDPGSMALQLAPREFERSSADSSATANQTQTAGPATARSAVSPAIVDRVYNQSIEYRYLHPTIHSKGLQATSFGWDLEDEMLTPSAKRFIAIVAVTRGATAAKCTMTVSIRIRQTFWSKIDEAVSDPVPCDIALPH